MKIGEDGGTTSPATLQRPGKQSPYEDTDGAVVKQKPTNKDLTWTRWQQAMKAAVRVDPNLQHSSNGSESQGTTGTSDGTGALQRQVISGRAASW